MADAAPILVPFDGTLLERPLEGPPPPASDGDAPDARVEALTEAVARGDYAGAARTAEALLREGVHDARLVGPYLFGSFQERGLLAMASVFRSVHQVLTASHAALGPVDKRDVFLDSGLRWLLRSLNKHLAHQEKKKDATWQRWCEPECRAPLEEALTLSEPILTALSTALPRQGCEEPFRNLALWLHRHVQALPAPAPTAEVRAIASAPAAASASTSVPANVLPLSAPVPAVGTSTAFADSANTGTPTAFTPPTNAGAPETTATGVPAASVPATGASAKYAHATGTPPASEPQPGLPISPAMAVLLRKLAAFNALLDSGDAAKAGIIASDVLSTVERFDPRVYLPALFSRFFSGLSTHAHELEPFLHGEDSLPQRALEQLYRVDLDAFLAQPVSHDGEED